jgi:hypothetical protein
VRERAKTPVYSHTWENTASGAVARSLGLQRIKREMAYA